MDTGGYGVGVFEIWRLWVPPLYLLSHLLKCGNSRCVKCSLLNAQLNHDSLGSCHKRQKSQAPTPQAPIRNRQTRKVAIAKGLNRNTNLTQPNLT